MNVWKEVAIALAGVILTVTFDFATVAFVDQERFDQIKANHNKLIDFLVVPFDLWLVSFAVIVGVALSSLPEERNKVVPAAVALAVFLVFIICSFAMNSLFPNMWFKIFIPDLLGIALIGFTANQVIHR
ncbi:MAG: hypothetical protein QM796_00465 [Chthoniobacteraceae bacterium]